MSEWPKHGDGAVCAVCGGEIEWVEYTAWNGMDVDVLDAWWAHQVHPKDGHDGAPA